MEVEIKLKLADSTTHQNLLSLLSPFHKITHRQHNTFFDGAAAELSSRRAVLRLRFYDNNSKCDVCLKAKAVLVEEELDPAIGLECESAEPDKVKGLIEEFLKENGIAYSYSNCPSLLFFGPGNFLKLSAK